MRRLIARTFLIAGVIAQGVTVAAAREPEPLNHSGFKESRVSVFTGVRVDALVRSQELPTQQPLIDKKQVFLNEINARVYGAYVNSDAPEKLWQIRGLDIDNSKLIAQQSDENSVANSDQQTSNDGSALIDQSTLPNAIDLKGSRPRVDPSVVPPAATTLSEPLLPLDAPPNLALPDTTSEVRIRQLRPLTLEEVEQIVEVNSLTLKAAALQVEQSKSMLLAALSAWYPTINLSANGLPQYLGGEAYYFAPPAFEGADPTITRTISQQQSATFQATAQWKLIDPARVPQIAAARDTFEKARNTYLIALRDARLNAAIQYFALQKADEGVRIGKQSVGQSIVSLRDAMARFQAGVATKLEVLEAETQLARDKQTLTKYLADQSKGRRDLASILDLPQDITPTAASPTRVLGVWQPSLEESIIAAYTFREELDGLILDISINNSNANAYLAAIQPVLSLFDSFSTTKTQGQSGVPAASSNVDWGNYSWSQQNAVGLSVTWSLFDGGRARANYRYSKQKAQESETQFASQRNAIRQEVEDSFYTLLAAGQNIETTSREVISARESLRLSRLRFQAGVTTQREVVNTQRDLTQAEVRYADSIVVYNSSLARLSRRTGLDSIQACQRNELPSKKPEPAGYTNVPIEPTPHKPACEASALQSLG